MQHAIFQAKHIFIENWLTYNDPLLRHLKIELKQNRVVWFEKFTLTIKLLFLIQKLIIRVRLCRYLRSNEALVGSNHLLTSLSLTLSEILFIKTNYWISGDQAIWYWNPISLLINSKAIRFAYYSIFHFSSYQYFHIFF